VQELDRVERLGHVGGDPEVVALLHVGFLRSGGQQHDRHRATARPGKPAGDLPAVELGHHDIEQHQVRPESVEEHERLLTVRGDLDRVPLQFQIDLE
jgi:hypothetical protein